MVLNLIVRWFLVVEMDEKGKNYFGSGFRNHGDVIDEVIVLIFLFV